MLIILVALNKQVGDDSGFDKIIIGLSEFAIIGYNNNSYIPKLAIDLIIDYLFNTQK